MLALALLACIDYRVVTPPVTPVPALAAAPQTIALDGICGGEEQVITLTNPGTGPTTITAITVDGMGWTVPVLPALPFTLEPLLDDPAAHLDLALAAGAGVATLVVSSDAPEVDVPLRASDNQHPTVVILNPYEDEVVGEDDDLLLTGLVADADDDLGDLTVVWVADNGFFSTAVPDADGRVETDWPADQRTAGPQLIQLVANDACEDQGETTLYYCQDGPFAIDVLGDEAWRFDGGASWDGSELTLVNGPSETGAGFDLFSLFDGDVLDVMFEVLLQDDGTGAPEGLSFTLLDPARVTTYIGGDGCGLGYGGDASCTSGPALPGWSVELDTLAGDDDCAVGDHVAVVVDGAITSPAGCASAALAGEWHTVELVVSAGLVSVVLDGVTVLDAAVPSGQAFEGFAGFTAATGVGGGTVKVRNVTVIDSTCVR